MAIEFPWLIDYVERVHDRTYEVAELLEDRLLDWRPRDGEFSFAELFTHIANSRLMNLATIEGQPVHYAGHEPPPRATPRVIQRHLEHSSSRVLEGLRRTDLAATVMTIRSTGTPAFALVVSGLIEHEVHHRSQLCEYLSAVGLSPPPLYGLHEENLPR